MSVALRIETALEGALERALAEGPSRLGDALRWAVFPGGARVRPTLCLAVAEACGEDALDLIDAYASAVELIHCASLVHDDLPAFDNAQMRRGKPSVHAAFGEGIALLAGDALIVIAFETLARAGGAQPHRLAPLVLTLARAAGSPFGIAAGQAFEAEPNVPLDRYHAAKTGALFIAATAGGAIAAGADPGPWRLLGDRLGAAYQIADDLYDACQEGDAGKPQGRDAALGRPNLVAEIGLLPAYGVLKETVAQAVAAIPPCPGSRALSGLVQAQATRLAPKALAKSAA
jgi:geranylgeranyl diphosphate synthase type II